jgi:hypothetical protein
MVEPFPSCPRPFSPTHSTAPPPRIAQARLPEIETEMAVTPLVRPGTGVGTALMPASLALASWPPQQCMAPAEVRAHAENPPCDTAVTPLESPVTGIGVELPFGCEVSPRDPCTLFPQHSTPPPLVIAQAFCQPAATAMAAPATDRDPELRPPSAVPLAPDPEHPATGATTVTRQATLKKSRFTTHPVWFRSTRRAPCRAYHIRSNPVVTSLRRTTVTIASPLDSPLRALATIEMVAGLV